MEEGGGGLAWSMQMDRKIVFMKTLSLGGLSAHAPGLYTRICT